MSNWPILPCGILVVLVAVATDYGWAQQPSIPRALDDQEVNSSTISGDNAEDQLKVTARYYLVPNRNEGFVIVRFQIPSNHHIYGVHQPKDAPQTRLELQAAKGVKFTGPFRPDKKPTVKKNDPVFGMTIVEHTGDVQFYAPIEIPEGFDVERDSMQIRLNGQMCSDEGYCLPIMGRKVPIRFAGYYQRRTEQRRDPHRR